MYSAMGLVAAALLLSDTVASLHTPVVRQEAVAGNQTVSTGITPCDAIANAGLGHLLLLPTDAAYGARIEEGWWSASARLYPWCIIQPSSTEEVSQVVQVLGAAAGTGEWGVAVRGGGHNQWASNNIDNGAVIDLGKMNATTYDAATTLASLGPGGYWGGVYRELKAHNVTAVGGRVASVGVSGFLTGGGMSYHSNRHGLGCDQVANFEVVLPNGTVVNANSATNADLHRALKGGGSNFGIVTRFDVATVPSASTLYTGVTRMANLTYSDETIAAFTDFVGAHETMLDDQVLVLYQYDNATSPGVTMMTTLANTQGNTSTAAFDAFLALPAATDGLALVDLYDWTTRQAKRLTGGVYNVWLTTTFANNADITRKSAEIFTQLVDTLKAELGPGVFSSRLLLQPVPSYFGDIADANGGNVLGLDRTQNAVLAVFEINLATEAHRALAHAHGSARLAELEAYIAASSVGAYAWKYINYADPSQDVFASYGAANVDFLRAVADKYDPAGTFQTLFPKGFKISGV